MGAEISLMRRVVFDTGVVISALLFEGGQLAWLRRHWCDGECVPLVSRATAAELARVLGYSKFKLSVDDSHELLAEYLPHCEVVDAATVCSVVCRDAKDQMFLDLAESGEAGFLITGDADLLELAGRTRFAIQSTAEYGRYIKN